MLVVKVEKKSPDDELNFVFEKNDSTNVLVNDVVGSNVAFFILQVNVRCNAPQSSVMLSCAKVFCSTMSPRQGCSVVANAKSAQSYPFAC